MQTIIRSRSWDYLNDTSEPFFLGKRKHKQEGVKMQTITRSHNFENKLTMVKQKTKYLFGYWEKSINPIKIKRTKENDMYFANEDWGKLEAEFVQNTANRNPRI